MPLSTRIVAVEPRKIAYEDFVLPVPGPGQVLARTVISGISHGTEMTAFLGTSPMIERTFGVGGDRVFVDKTADDPAFYPFRYLGYDAVGIVEAVGAGVANFAEGDRIWCAARHQTRFLFDAATEEAAVLADGVANEAAIMTNLTSVALGATNDAEIKLGDAVVVVGGGVIGQLIVQMARLSGARTVFLVEPIASRRAFAAARTSIVPIDPADGMPARQVSALNGGSPPDVVIEASGSVHGLQSALQTAGVGGTVIAAGFYAGNASALIMGEEFLHNRITIKASMTVWGCPSRFPERWNRARVWREALHLLEDNRLNLEGFVSECFPFTQAQAAYEAIAGAPADHMKVAFVY